MHPNDPLPDDQTPGHEPSTRQRRTQWLNLFYTLGLLLVFLISLLLLPADVGIGRLLRGALAAC